ncbi:hypothetical protein GCM10023331_16690 [Algivirga pacifica]|uniref:GAF domain-containing protein n=1 Tax=Algivirga pacifica TaxID=1162670 RepID=A0ABP9D6I0_9BACT
MIWWSYSSQVKALEENEELFLYLKDCNNWWNKAYRLSNELALEEVKQEAFYTESQKLKEVYAAVDTVLLKLNALSKYHYVQEKRSELPQLVEKIKTYKIKAHVLTQKHQQRGYGSWGEIGRLDKKLMELSHRASVPSSLCYTLQVAQKNFLLTNDMAFVGQFDRTVENLREKLLAIYKQEQASLLLEQQLQETLVLLSNCQYIFHSVVEYTKDIGSAETEGVGFQLYQLHREVVMFLDNLEDTVEMQIYSDRQGASRWFYICLIFELLLFLVVLGGLLGKITNSVTSIDELLDKILRQDYHTSVSDKISVMEMETVYQSLQQLEVKLKNTKWLLNHPDEVNHKGDILFIELTELLNSRALFKQESEKQTWLANSITRLNVQLAKARTLPQVGESLLEQLLSLLKIGQAAVFILEEERDALFFQQIASYALDTKRFSLKRIALEDGLLGQVYHEQDTLLIRDIPEDYMHISSGLGEATPTLLLLKPLMLEGKVYGVLELASFQEMEAEHLLLIDHLATNATVMIKNILLMEQRDKAVNRANNP